MGVTARTANDWIYLKLYLGSQIDRADAFVVEMANTLATADAIDRWFYLRFIDDDGFHIRLRVLPKPRHGDEVAAFLSHDIAPLLDRLYRLLPSSYAPMVSLPDYLEAEAPPQGQRVRLLQEPYEPEHDKYGSGTSMEICEDLFCISSALAARVLADEAAGVYSRKSLAPWLMYETNRALPSFETQRFWRDYSLYWLGGDGPAAQDWRARFIRKSDELAAMDDDVLDDLPAEGEAIVAEWRAALMQARARLDALPAAERPDNDVLSVNIAHLTNNRLGIAMLEEAYLATLLEHRMELAA